MKSPRPSWRFWRFTFALLLWVVLGLGSSRAQVITEFLTQNDGLLQDEEGDTPDWIEIHNPTSQAVSLQDWALTDSSTNLVKWRFPSTNLGPGSFLVVFASGKDRRVAGAPLHTNFRLDNDGEFLALVAADGKTIASSFAPQYPPQLPNISYGVRQRLGSVTVLSPSNSARVHVPVSEADAPAWMSPEFDDSHWTAGLNGVGYETSPAEYSSLIQTDVRSAMSQNGSCYIRLPFLVDDPAAFTGWRLLMLYDDGFVAYLNGQEVARANAPDDPAWNATATANHPDNEAVVPEEFDLSAAQDLIVRGTNVLALHGLNTSTTSSDFLVVAMLEAQPLGMTEAIPGYFTTPTPGSANTGGVSALGPIIHEVAQEPLLPSSTNALVVTAQVTPAFEAVASVTLHYRVMYGPEIELAMRDDGAHGDGAVGDGLFGAIIPAGAAETGEMLRYYVTATDTAQNGSRLPLFLDRLDSAEYLGTVITDTPLSTKLPVVWWYAQNAGQAGSFGGSRCSVWYLGEFYDNVRFSVHGQSSSGFPKRGFNVDFARDHRFRYATNSPAVKDIKLLTNYADKSRTRNTLAYDFIREAGSVGHFAFPVRVQLNGQFHAILDLMEDADDGWLERVGLDPDGALYKVYNALDSAGGSEKKTRKSEGLQDLQDLVNNLNPARPLATRVTYAYDNIDLPQTVSYFVALALVSSQDHGHKNFYVYRDTEGSGEWAIFPWDVDLSWGRNWIDSGGYFTDRLYTNNVLNFYNPSQQLKPSNRLYSLIFSDPAFRHMYLRRLRTVMDTILQPPGTPAADLIIERRIRELLDLMDPPEFAESDADLDYEKWGSWGNRLETREEAQRIIDLHLPGRRDFLFNSPAATLGGDRIPDAQPTNALLVVGELEFNPGSGNQEQEYIQLLNPNAFALDVSGWKVEGAVEYQFRPGTVIPESGQVYLSPNVSSFRARTTGPRAGQSLFVQGNYRGQLSARGEALRILDTGGRLVASTNYPGSPTPAQQSLHITELMYHPAAPTAGSTFDDEDFEFVELTNAGATPLDLNGVQFTRGVQFNFTGSAVTNLAPGESVIVGRNAAALIERYGAGLHLAGVYAGTLDNAGEELRLQDKVGEVVFDFNYSPKWHPATDGTGYSLVIARDDLPLGSSQAWKPSEQLGGSPAGVGGSAPLLHNVALVEGTLVVTFHAEPQTSYILYSTTDLTGGTWQVEKTIAGPPAPGEIQVTIANVVQAPARFYRIGF